MDCRSFSSRPIRKGTTDFSAILAKVRAANPDVLAAATYFEDAVAITRQLKELNVNPKMFAVTVGGDLPKFYEILGRGAEFVYGASQWEPELVTLRAGGLIPIARQYPGAREFVESYRKEFPGAELSYHSAAGYGGCQVLMEAIRRAGSLDSEKIRDAILKMDLNTVYRRVQGGPGRLPDRAQDGDVPVAGRQEGDRLARGAGAGQAALPHAAVEPARKENRRPERPPAYRS